MIMENWRALKMSVKVSVKAVLRLWSTGEL
jgi:hypothetical protein